MSNSRTLKLSILFILFLFVGYISATPVPATKGRAFAKAPGKARTKASPNIHASKARGAAPVKSRNNANAKRARKDAAKHAPAGGSCPSRLHPRGGKTFLGYNGFNGTPRPAQASGGGELGAVFYIADSVDLAKAFARGVNPAKDHVCMVYADGDAWAAQPKVWIPAHAPRGRAMDSQYPGAVLFDHHTNAGLPAGSPPAVHQMGIRNAQISRLGVTVECFPKSCFATDHHTMNYPSLKQAWSIQVPR